MGFGISSFIAPFGIVKIFIFVLGILSSFQALSSEGFQARLRQAEGKTFEALGPNCFATAMKLSGITSSYRDMDDKEFAVIQKNFCQRVDQPQPGDIGVFETPRFGFVHAYVYVSSGWGMQKPGVDYNGKTPISLQALDSINYTYLASPECRRYSKNISECSNLHYYVRCQSFSSLLTSYNPLFETTVRDIEARMEGLLENGPWTPVQKQLASQLYRDVADLRDSLNKMVADETPQALREYISARQTSLEKQAQFLQQKAK